jgi:hypothetical protein
MADDLDSDYKQDRLAIMPNLRTRIRDAGLTFTNHVAAQPVCGPSRSSLLAGRYPHNTGYIANNEPASVEAWRKLQNNTVGTWLTTAGCVAGRRRRALAGYPQPLAPHATGSRGHERRRNPASSPGRHPRGGCTPPLTPPPRHHRPLPHRRRRYHTAYLGKYVNGLEDNVPSGWNHWGGFSSGVGTYNYYNASRWNVTFDDAGTAPVTPIAAVVETGVHQADFLGPLAVAQAAVAVAKGRPFFISLTPVMVHWGTCVGPNPPGGYAATDPVWEMNGLTRFGCTDPRANVNCTIPISPCPTTRHAHDFDGLTNPHVPSWNTTVAGAASVFERSWPALTAYEAAREDAGYRNRTASAVDLDDMIGVVLDGLADLGVLSSTLVIVTSDNGYHLGEHRFVFGKSQPFETDVRLPLFIAGPGVPANDTRAHPTNHLDITATLVDVAGATPVGPPLDGLSFRAALTADPVPPAAWRNFSFSEYFAGPDTWVKVRFPSHPAAPGGGAVGFHWWCTGTGEVFDLAADPWELTNSAEGGSAWGDAVANATLPMATFLHTCAGPACSSPAAVDPLPPVPLPCANVTRGWDAFDP